MWVVLTVLDSIALWAEGVVYRKSAEWVTKMISKALFIIDLSSCLPKRSEYLP